MDDQFLNDHYQAPRTAFTRGLARRLAAVGEPAPRGARPVLLGWLRAAALAAVALALAVGFAAAVSPAARAEMLAQLRQVGGVLFTEQGTYPGGPGQPEIVPSQNLSLDAARTAFPAEIALPAWLPEGYAPEPELTLTDFSDYGFQQAQLAYRRAEPHGTAFFLSIWASPGGEEHKMAVGPDSLEEVTVNGQPAALLRGIWNSQTRAWDDNQHLTLSWQHNGATYQLSAHAFALSVDDLLRIAESVP